MDKLKQKDASKRNEGTKQQTLVEGAFILMIGVALAKIIGAICKIPLANIIEEAGMGYYSSAYNLYLPFFTLASAGFPAALSRQVAESVTMGRYKDALKVRKIARNIFLITGSVCFAGMVIMGFVLTKTNVRFSIDSNAIYAILAMCPSVFLCCVMGAYRGYNEGLRNMIPTAVSQVIEAAGKLVVGLSVAAIVVKVGENKFLEGMKAAGAIAGSGAISVKVFGRECFSLNDALNASYPFAAAGALLGITLGSAFALLYLVVRFKVKGLGITKEQIKLSPEPRDTRLIIRTFLAIGVPIALGVLAQNFTQLIDSLTVQGQIKSLDVSALRAVYGENLSLVDDEGISNFLWGVYNYGITLYNLVPYLTQVFGTSALPALASAWLIKDSLKVKESINSVLKLGVLIAFPAGIGIFALSSEIMQLLYPGSAAAQICPPMLRVLGIMALFGAMAAPINSMLQAVGKQMTPVKLMACAAVIKIVLNYTLVGIQSINIKGAPFGSLAFYIFIVVAGLIVLCKTTSVRPDIISTFGKPFACAALCGFSAWGTARLLQNVFSVKLVTVAAIAIAGVVYVISLFLLKTLTKNDILLLPKGEKMLEVLEKFGWIV